jgi:hypothetical protein
MEKIDWKNLESLPLKRQLGLDREHLAAVSHTRKAAKHKGRNHWRNWERRQMTKAKKTEAAKRDLAKQPSLARYRDAVRAYWRGEADQHPGVSA